LQWEGQRRTGSEKEADPTREDRPIPGAVNGNWRGGNGLKKKKWKSKKPPVCVKTGWGQDWERGFLLGPEKKMERRNEKGVDM